MLKEITVDVQYTITVSKPITVFVEPDTNGTTIADQIDVKFEAQMEEALKEAGFEIGEDYKVEYAHPESGSYLDEDDLEMMASSDEEESDEEEPECEDESDPVN